MNYLKKSFYSMDALMLSKKLLGKILVHNVDGKILKGKIIETEAYIGEIDKACHAYGGKRTPKTEPLYGKAGIDHAEEAKYFPWRFYIRDSKFISKK